ncbi:hypothetical protein Purlil1_11801 [Purpureocillium lilacinum]|uniref:Uncharacterized protein n=1 Tax=Purpureocillium lilacinum TaxID=33203 RepID=A0ABR0BIL2_PURLI|nr:hypothetical protein Purlil1_11801 [Purpureocillium lilacinum]
MSAAREQRGIQHGLPSLDSIWTLPLLATSDPGFDFEKIFFTPTSTNPGSLQYHESPQSMAMDHWSPFGNGFNNLARDNPFADCLDELDWMTTHLTGLEESSWHVTGYHDEKDVRGPGDYIGASRRTTPGEQKQSTNTECMARPAP